MKKYNAFAAVAVIVAILNAGQTAPTSGNYTAALLAIIAAAVLIIAGVKEEKKEYQRINKKKESIKHRAGTVSRLPLKLFRYEVSSNTPADYK